MLAAMWQFIKRYPMTYLIILLSIIANYILWVIPTRVTQAIIDAMADHSLTGQSLALFIGIILVVSVGQYTSEYLWMSRLFSQSAFYIKEVKLNLYQKIISMRIQFFEKFRSGDMMTRFTSDVRGIEDFMGYGLMGFLLSAGTYFIIIPIMLSISWKVTLLALIPSSLILVPLVILTRRQEEAVTQQRDAVAALSNEVLEVIEGIRVTRAYGNKQEASQRFQAKTRDLASKADRIMYYQAAFGRLSITIMSLTAALVIGVGGLEMAAGHLTLGQIIALQLYSVSLAEPLWSLTDLIVVYQNAKVSHGKIQELLEASDDLASQGTQRLSDLEELSLADYSFRYQGASEDSLRHIDLRLKKGQTLGIVGKTGSGKTTLVRQFLCQYPIGQGEFLVNNRPISDFNRHDMEKLIGYVPQEHLLFSRTVRENILLGNPSASQKQVDVAVAIAAFSQDLERMSEGYDTLIGEKGVAISGGQKQRISIARAMIKEPELLILDDALSAVDARTERIIIENIQTLRAGKTNIITTHRLSAVEHADWIVVLDQGRIVEEGRAEDLMALGGWYAEQAWRQRLNEEVSEEEVMAWVSH